MLQRQRADSELVHRGTSLRTAGYSIDWRLQTLQASAFIDSSISAALRQRYEPHTLAKRLGSKHPFAAARCSS
jgi:hypothetical protein